MYLGLSVKMSSNVHDAASIWNKLLISIADAHAPESNVDDAVFIWNKLFISIADAHAPIKRRQIWGHKIPWMT